MVKIILKGINLFTTLYAVLNDNKIIYMGPDKLNAYDAFEANPGSLMNRVDSLEALTALVNGKEPQVKAQNVSEKTPFDCIAFIKEMAQRFEEELSKLGPDKTIFELLKEVQNKIPDDAKNFWARTGSDFHQACEKFFSKP